jgi:DNA-binding NarL/FixJ family response regulator
MLTSHNDPDQIFASLKAGASGYLLKPIKPKELLQSIRDVRQGGAPMSSQVARKVVESFQTSGNASKMPKLTPRETEILDGLAHGLLYKEIAEKLTIGVTTVRTHLGSIYQKLHVQNRTEAVVRYLGH